MHKDGYGVLRDGIDPCEAITKLAEYEDTELIPDNIRELFDDVVAYQSDLKRVECRHDAFLEHLIDLYNCPPTQTAETCKGDDRCRDCWCEWAESKEEKNNDT